MKMINLIISQAASSSVFLSALAQGTFQNLNFEQANPISAGAPGAPYFVTAASALPSWSVYYSGIQQTQVSYNAVSTGATQVTLISTGNPLYNAIDGNYSVLLQGIVPGSEASISQTGTIPSATESLLFEAQAGIGPLDVQLGTQIVPFSTVGSGPNYTLYAADISAWAGDTEELTFSAIGGSYNNWELDDISFSPNTIPEPATLALVVMGVLALAARRWRAKGL
jgi:hypothetical protein